MKIVFLQVMMKRRDKQDLNFWHMSMTWGICRMVLIKLATSCPAKYIDECGVPVKFVHAPDNNTRTAKVQHKSSYVDLKA